MSTHDYSPWDVLDLLRADRPPQCSNVRPSRDGIASQTLCRPRVGARCTGHNGRLAQRDAALATRVGS